MLIVWRREGFSSAAPRKRRRRKRASVLSCAALRRLLLRTSCLCAMAKNAIASKHFLRMSGARTSVKPDFLISLLRATKKPAKRRVFMAQRRGFEPPDESPPSHDFQSCSLNHSDISAKPCNHIIFPRKRQLILRAFRQKVFGKFLFSPPLRSVREKTRKACLERGKIMQKSGRI